MKLADGTILMHGDTPYDPVKAHEYYIRTRQLKGRHGGSPSFSVKTRSGRTVTLSTQELTEQRAYAAKRVTEIKAKLHLLEQKLREAMREAKKKKRDSEKPKTAAEKAQDARDAKQYRSKHRTKLAAKRKHERKTKRKSDPVSELEDKIANVKVRLHNAIAVQRALTSATKNN